MRSFIGKGMASAADRASASRLRKHQVEVVTDTAAHISEGASQSVCIAPTGVGKTEIFQTLVSGSCQDDPDTGRRLVPNTVILVPSRQLIHQTVDRFKKSYPDLPVGFLSDIHGSEVGPISVGSYHGFVQAVQEGRIDGDDVDHLVLDEAHRALSDLRMDTFGRFVGRSVISAYTASPVYRLTKHLYELLGKDNTVANIPIRRMIDDKVLAPIVNYVVRIRLNGELPTDPKLRSAVLSHAAAEAACSFYLQPRPDIPGGTISNKPFLGYTHGVAASHAAAEIFRGLTGKRIAGLSGRDPTKVQGGALEQLGDGRMAGIFNARLLIEGTDVPKVSLILNLSQTGSLVNQIQRCGRGIRMDPAIPQDDPAQTAAIVDFFFEVNGKPIGRPKFFFEALGDVDLARLVSSQPRSIEDILANLSDEERRDSEVGDDDGLAVDEDEGPGEDVQDDSSEDDNADLEDRLKDLKDRASKARMLSGFEVDSDVKSVAFMLRRLDGSRNEDWLSLSEVKRLFRTAQNEKALDLTWAAMAQAARAGKPVRVAGRRVDFAILKDSSGHFHPYIAKAEVEWLAQHHGIPFGIALATDEWMGRTAVQDYLNLDHKAVGKAWSRLLAEDEGTGVVEVDGRPFRFERLRGRRISHFLHVDDVQAFEKLVRVVGLDAPKTDEWLKLDEAARALGVSTQRLGVVWDRLVSDGQSTTEATGGPRFERRLSGNVRTPWCIHVDELDWLKGAVGVANRPPSKTSEWFTKNDIAVEFGLDARDKVLTHVWKGFLEAFKLHGSISVPGRSIRADMRRTIGTLALCIHRDSLPEIRAVIDGTTVDLLQGDPDWLSVSGVTSRLGVTSRNRRLTDFLASLTRQSKDVHGEVEIDGIKVASMRSEKTPIRIHKDSLPGFAARIGVTWPPVPAKTDDWLGKTALAGAIGSSATNPRFQELWASLPEGDHDEGRLFPTKVLKRIQWGPTHHVHVRHVGALARSMGSTPGLPPITAEWVTHDVANRLKEDFRGSYSRLLESYAEIARQLESGRPATISGVALRAELRNHGGKPVACVHKDDLPALMRTLKAQASPWPDKDAGWFAVREAGTALGIGLPARLKEVWVELGRLARKAGSGDVVVDVEGKLLRCGIRISKLGQETICLHAGSLDVLKSMVESPDVIPYKDNEWLTATELGKALGRPLTAGSELHKVVSYALERFKTSGHGVLPNGERVSMSVRRTSSKTKATCFHDRDVDVIRSALTPRTREALPAKMPGMLARTEAALVLRVSKGNVDLAFLWEGIEAAATSGYEFVAHGETIKPLLVAARNRQVVVIMENDVDSVGRMMDAQRDQATHQTSLSP